MSQKLIYFLHLHKCAGSTLVNLAKKNTSVYKVSHNGNPTKREKLIQFWAWDFLEQTAWLADLDCHFIANEACIGENLVSTSLVDYITVLRDPLDRVYSQFLHEQQTCRYYLSKWEQKGRTELVNCVISGGNLLDYKGLLQEITPKDFSALMDCKKFLLCDFEEFILNDCFEVFWSNNYIVKQLSVDNYKKIATRGDQELAMERISRFSCVMFCDTLGDDIKKMKKLGWSYLDIDAARGGTNSNATAREIGLSAKAMAKLEDANSLDIEFYRRCKEAFTS